MTAIRAVIFPFSSRRLTETARGDGFNLWITCEEGRINIISNIYHITLLHKNKIERTSMEQLASYSMFKTAIFRQHKSFKTMAFFVCFCRSIFNKLFSSGMSLPLQLLTSTLRTLSLRRFLFFKCNATTWTFANYSSPQCAVRMTSNIENLFTV